MMRRTVMAPHAPTPTRPCASPDAPRHDAVRTLLLSLMGRRSRITPSSRRDNFVVVTCRRRRRDPPRPHRAFVPFFCTFPVTVMGDTARRRPSTAGACRIFHNSVLGE